MAYKFKLIIRNTSSPHLYLDNIKEILKDDDYLLPQMRKTLLLLKKFKRSFIQLPLQMDVIISPEFKCNLERALSPQLLNFNKTDWDEKDFEKYTSNKLKFIDDAKILYNKMGYDIEEGVVDVENVKVIVEDIDKKLKKFGGGLLDKI